MRPPAAATPGPAASTPLATIEALPDASLGRVLVLVGRKRCHITAAVCRRWRRLVFGEPRLWRSITLGPGLLAPLAKKKDKQGWFACQHTLLRRIAPLVVEAAVEGGTVIEAAGAATGKWGVGDLLSALGPSTLVQLPIQGPWSLPAAALSALGRLSGLTYLEVDSAELAGEALLAAVGQLAALRTFELITDGAPQGLPVTLARLSGLQQLHLEADLFWQLEDVVTCLTSLTGLHIELRDTVDNTLPAHALLPAMRQLHLATAGWFAGPEALLFKEAWYSADDKALCCCTDGPAGPFHLGAVTAALLPSGAPLHCMYLAGCCFRPEDVNGWSCREALTELELGSCMLEPGTLCELLRQLPRLAALRLHYRTLTPHAAGDLARLSADAPALGLLSLQHNELHELPDTIDLTGGRLRALNLTNNRLARLPPVLATATALTSLLLGGNPNLPIRKADVEQTLAAMPALASLTVRRGSLGQAVMTHISRVLPGLAVVEEAEAGTPAYQPPPRSEVSSSSDDEL